MVLSSIIYNLDIESGKPTIVLVVLGVVVWLLGLWGSIKSAYQAFGSLKGVLLWCLLQVLLLLYLLSVLMVGLWCLWLLVVFLNAVFKDANFRTITSAGWAQVILLIGVCVWIACKILISRLVIEPSRKRCRELSMQWLSEYQASLESQEPSNTSNV